MIYYLLQELGKKWHNLISFAKNLIIDFTFLSFQKFF